MPSIDKGDVGLAALTGDVSSLDTNGPEARKVLRKIDLHLLPLLCVTYMLQFLDKSCVSTDTVPDDAAEDIGHAVHREPDRGSEWLFGPVDVEDKARADASFQHTEEEASRGEAGEVVGSGHAKQDDTPENDEDGASTGDVEFLKDDVGWEFAGDVADVEDSREHRKLYSEWRSECLCSPHCQRVWLHEVRVDPAQYAQWCSTGRGPVDIWIHHHVWKGIRHFVMIGGMLVAILGASLIYALPDSERVARLIGYYVLVGFSVTYVQSLNLFQANVAGRTKKTVFTASLFVCYCVGNLIGPQLFFQKEKPRYQSGFTTMIVCFAVQILIIAALYITNWRENRRRDRLMLDTAAPALGLSDKTDRENLHFRYML
ncbi:hypothetical protein BDW59DRAFT_162020 [Aspergillus cavernicola]|uniref:Major facilitator superfamily domain-containing protein n=1 Tax=Aspergillus cavernicola TaxID=176166 RepID=A0ABR4ICQ9_9EURO